MPGSKRKKVSIVPQSPQKKYKKMSKFPLEDLPNEVLLKVFSYLQIHDLFYCGHVNQRIRLLTREEKLWQKISISRVYLYLVCSNPFDSFWLKLETNTKPKNDCNCI